MFYSILTLFILLFGISPKDQGSTHSALEYTKFCRIRVVNSSDSILTISTSCTLLPGVVLPFDSSYYLVFQRLDDSLYLAHYYTLIRSVKNKKAPKVGTEINFKAPYYPPEKDYQYWLDIQNNFLSSKSSVDGQWLGLENSTTKGSNSLKVGDPIMLAIKNPPIEGYLCVLAIDAAKSTIIYPNNFEGTQNYQRITYRGSINLTYHRENGLHPAFINVFFKAQQPGNLCFVAIICSTPTPLADLLPERCISLYQGLDGKELPTWTIGPGWYQPLASTKSSKGIEYLKGDSWAVSKLNIKII